MAKRTRLSICQRKVRYATAQAATMAAVAGGWQLRPYRCDRGAHYHLTSRIKGRHTPQAVRLALLPATASSGSEGNAL